MAHKIDLEEMLPFEELLLTTIRTQERLIALLEQKGVVTKEEVIGEMRQGWRNYENIIWS